LEDELENALKGKVAIVTGSGKGIGAGIARVFASQGAKVLVADYDESWGTKCVTRIKEIGGDASYVKVDVSKAEDTARMAATAIERYGRIDILCNNAGIYTNMAEVVDMTEGDWDKIISVDLKGCFLTSKAVLPQMLKQGYGRILFTSSTTGPKTAIIGLSHYAAAKAGINGYIKNLALEVADKGITVNGVEPGNILTEGMIEVVGEEWVRANAAVIPGGQLGEPEDIAYAMTYLATDEAKFVTGQTICVDGGQTLPESAWGRS
jgi:3-oxoacyl-[acyl-carrier protein] reductase